MNKILISMICFAVLIVFSGVVSAEENVSECGTINAPGVYVLNQSIGNSSTCIRIESSDVVFDGQGYSIGPGDTGIYVYNSSITLANVTVRNVTVTGWVWSGIYYRNAENGSITNNNASNNFRGIWLVSSSSNNTITDNTANSNNWYGIGIYNSSNNTITNNTANGNSGIWEGYGIDLTYSSGNTLEGNTANSNKYYGINLWSSSNNTFTNNTASYNNYGIFLSYSSSNTLTNNTASYNYYGIRLYSSSYNTIYNNLFNNTANSNYNSTNDWNTTQTLGTNIIGGPYLGGNFWTKPNGNGFSETCTDSNSDGICDSSYMPTSGNVDYLPLSLNFTTTTTTSTTTTTTTTSTTTTTTTSTTTSTSTTSSTTTSTTTTSSTTTSTSTSTTSTTTTTTSTTSSTTTSSTTTTTTTSTTTTSSTTTTTVRSSGGGGGGGGGTPTSYATYIKDVSKGGTSSLDIDDEDVPYLIGLSLTAKQDIYSSRLSITDLKKKPYYSMAEPDATVYRYFKVRYDKDSYVENASLDFRVNMSWLEDSNISQDTFRMYRYTTTWEELDTEFTKEDDKWVYFRAETPGFSYFSIGGEIDSGYKSVLEEEEEISAPVEEKPVEPPKLEAPTPAPPVETSSPEPEQEPVKAPEAPSEEEKGICGPTVVVLLAMVVLLFRRFKAPDSGR